VVSQIHISNTRHSSSALTCISLEVLLLTTSALFWWTKELMGNTTVRGEWKTSKSATRPTHRIVSVVPCRILQVPPISYLYKYIYAKLRRSIFRNFLCDFVTFFLALPKKHFLQLSCVILCLLDRASS